MRPGAAGGGGAARPSLRHLKVGVVVTTVSGIGVMEGREGTGLAAAAEEARRRGGDAASKIKIRGSERQRGDLRG